MAFTLVLTMAVPLLLRLRFSLGPVWIVPLVEALLLGPIIAIDGDASTAGRLPDGCSPSDS